MKINILSSMMERNEDKRFVGKVQFTVEGHKEPYEITLESKNMKDWGYSLHYSSESGPDGEIEALDQFLEEDEEAFDLLAQAAESAYKG